MNNLIQNFPIQVTDNRVLIKSHKEFLDFVDKYNTKITLYYSLYSPQLKTHSNTCCNIEQNKYHFCNAKIDKICFDIDNLNALSIIKNMHKFLLQENLKHLILFSGEKGFHLYIYTKNYESLTTPKNALLNSHNFLISKMNLKNGIDVDHHIIGDVSRLMRIPNTLHLNSKLYCIPLTTEDLILGKQHIMQKAKKQNFIYTTYGLELFDIKKFDNGFVKHIIPQIETPKIEISIDKQELINNMFPCIQDILLNSYVFWRSRFHLLKNLLSLGYSDSEIDMIMKTFLSGKKHPIKLHDNYEHYLKENQFQYVKRNKSLFSCNKVKQDGLCNLDCNCKKIIERPLYL